MVVRLAKGIFASAFGITLSCVSVSAFAYDFSAADAEYFKRQDGRAAIAVAVSAYEEALTNQLSVDEKAYAVEQISRLLGYESFIVDPEDTDLIMSIGEKCLEKVKLIEPSALGAETPQYYYWHASCRLFWAKAKGVFAALTYAKQVLDLINTGLALEPSYEGGGFDRLAAILLSNLPNPNPLGGPSGDMEKANQHFLDSFDSPAYESPLGIDWLDPETETGEYYYGGYYFYALALKKQGDVQAAISVLDKAIKMIEVEGKNPRGREPETKVSLDLMKQLRAELS